MLKELPGILVDFRNKRKRVKQENKSTKTGGNAGEKMKI